MLKRVFGPVPSRRLGQSLGIDPVPLKDLQLELCLLPAWSYAANC
jgi:wyosine [tRNA(Phe)-imidazoG37] synthetase (radical SAM superfamily)